MKTVVVGAGPVGALAAIYSAHRGHEVEVYELRNDLRDPSTTPLNFTKSINLALSERGMNAIRCTERPGLIERVMTKTIPMRGRMIHGKGATGRFTETPQDYDIHGRTIFAVDRGGLNKQLLDELELMPNVKVFFNHKLTGADFETKLAWFETRLPESANGTRAQEIEVTFDLLIGADGAHSSARYHMMKFTRVNYQQEYIDTLWCEFTLPAVPDCPKNILESKFRISAHHLHIWPGKDLMFIAIPSLDGTFTCTLFMPSGQFTKLEQDPRSVPDFFDQQFPGVTSLITPDTLISSFRANPHLPLISVKCQPYHYKDSGVILGDAAHAMVPFYGQGMNSGLEDVRILFSILDTSTTGGLENYSRIRAPDAAAINDLALANYVEMRASVTSPVYRLRKFLEEVLSVWIPSLGWQTKYSRVSFGNERYSDVVAKSERQGVLLIRGLVGVIATPFIVGGLVVWAGRDRKRNGLFLLTKLRDFIIGNY